MLKKIKVDNATGMQLSWLVAKALGHDPQYGRVAHGGVWHGWTVSEPDRYRHLPKYTKEWDRMMPIASKARIIYDYYIHPADDSDLVHARLSCAKLKPGDTRGTCWYAPARGATELEAIARCYVKSELGEEVEVPEELA